MKNKKEGDQDVKPGEKRFDWLTKDNRNWWRKRKIAKGGQKAMSCN